MARFFAIVKPQQDQVILDVGGTPFNWQLANYGGPVKLLNLSLPNSDPGSPNLSFVVGDGTALAFSDNSFEIVFSNSVIEHVGSFEKQKAFANEVSRVGRKLWIQTPAKSFFMEPHLLTPFVHWLPKAVQKKVLRNFTIWGWILRPTQENVDDFVDQTRLMTLKELTQLFPDCKIMKEKFLLMTKSYLVLRT
jgi:ubiquinone/menaquinone biosynthesis C-methylase UbiE